MTEWSSNPADYAVEMARIGGAGPLTAISIVSAAKRSDLFAGYADDSMSRLLDSARELERTDPYSGHLPSDSAIIRAALIDNGYEPDEEPDSDAPPPGYDEMVVTVWEVWTGNGRGLDTDDIEQTTKSVRDAVTNTWQPGIASDAWQAAALERLGHVSDEERQSAAIGAAFVGEEALAKMQAEQDALLVDARKMLGGVTALRRERDALLAALKDIVACASMAGAAGTTAYIISDERMTNARALVAKLEG